MEYLEIWVFHSHWSPALTHLTGKDEFRTKGCFIDSLWAGGRINKNDNLKAFPKDGYFLKYI